MISVVLVNYNTAAYTLQCVRSITETAHVPYEIIVVDNASPDGAGELEALDGGPVRLVRNRENRGFTGGNNDGVRAAKGEYVLILNNDTVVADGTVDALAAAMEHARPYDVLTGYITGPDGRPQQVCGREPTVLSELLRFAVMLVRYIPLRYYERFRIRTWERDEVQEADWATGAFFCMRRDFYDELGGFDENIFMYLDDLEFHTRVRTAGGRVVYRPELRITHFGGRSSQIINVQAYLYQYRSTAYFFSKHQGRMVCGLFVFFSKAAFLFWTIVFGIFVLAPHPWRGKLLDKLWLYATLLLGRPVTG